MTPCRERGRGLRISSFAGWYRQELARIAKHPYVAGQASEPYADDDDPPSAAQEDGGPGPPSDGPEVPPTAQEARAEAKRRRDLESGFKEILLLLRGHSGVDFSLYKATTIRRRIARRMVLNKQDTLTSYADFLHGNAKELDALYSDTLISVTSFFRNPEAFDVLRRKVFPKPSSDPATSNSGSGLRMLDRPGVFGAMAFLTADKARGAQAAGVRDRSQRHLTDKARQALCQNLEQDLARTLAAILCRRGSGYRIIRRSGRWWCCAAQSHQRYPRSPHGLISCRNVRFTSILVRTEALPVFHYAMKPTDSVLGRFNHR
jgi:two-component system CheB/CheR fusion protein